MDKERPVYADDVNYWKTGERTPAATWLSNAADQIRAVGGKVFATAEVEDIGGRLAYVIQFSLDGDNYKIAWPVLTPRLNNQVNLRAARVQSATALFHDVKARCVAVKFMGRRAAFLPFLVLASGATAAETSNEYLSEALPALPERIRL